MTKESNAKQIVILYHAPPGAHISNEQVVNEVNSIQGFCRQNNWKPMHTYIDKSATCTQYAKMMEFAADPSNNIAAILYFSAGHCLPELVGKNDAIIPDGHAGKANGNHVIGGVPYGYTVSDGALELDEDRSAIIREIFQSKADGESLQRIADALNGRGIKSARGGLWNKPGIAFILKNRAYVGEYKYDGVSYKIPEIVSLSLFDTVNRQ